MTRHTMLSVCVLTWWFMYLLPGMDKFEHSPGVLTQAECGSVRTWAVSAAQEVFRLTPTMAGKLIGDCQWEPGAGTPPTTGG